MSFSASLVGRQAVEKSQKIQVKVEMTCNKTNSIAKLLRNDIKNLIQSKHKKNQS